MADTAHFCADQRIRLCQVLTEPVTHQPLLQAQQLQVLQRLQLLGIQIHPSALSCDTGTALSGQNMLLAADSNLPINQWPKTT
jgi:hypothetical protein